MDYRFSKSDCRGQLAFTLVEVLVVVFVIALLLGLLTPAVIKARHSAQRAATEQYMGALTTACATFERDMKVLPPSDFKSPDVRKIAGAVANKSGLDDIYDNEWNGGELLFQALMGPLDVDEDGADGEGFRTGVTSRVYGPYVDAKSKNIAARFDKDGDGAAPKGGEEWRPYDMYASPPELPDWVGDERDDPEAYVFVDAWRNPICYYRAVDGLPNAAEPNIWDRDIDGSNQGRFVREHNNVIDGDNDVTDPETDGSPFLGGALRDRADPPPATASEYEDPIDHTRLLTAKIVFYSRGQDKLNEDGEPLKDQDINMYRKDDVIVVAP